MQTLISGSTKVAEHVALNGRTVKPAFVGRNDAERYRREAKMDQHIAQAWQQPDPDPLAYLAAERQNLARLDAGAVLATRLTLAGMVLVLGLVAIVKYYLG